MIVTLRVAPEGVAAPVVAAPDPVFCAMGIQQLAVATHGAQQRSRAEAGVGETDPRDASGDGLAAASNGIYGGLV
ncbi:hypothetical protein [Mycobacterium ostraviense]|uniref:hypothetical protein n=1 Tax=Mycobacterium ostraviense TaxID=2738409 RepID=UPI000C0799A4|nr:hypothetical protein [Mycobacterium ostraviense]UGT93498.1 hypothetical protein LTS72_09685 [Mycobacterium ostraviense]